jgi:CRP-like cAMP-binding protein
MFIKQADLFWGLNRELVKEVMDITEKESYGKGAFVFQEGDRAELFYILVKGRVKIRVGEPEHTVYVVSHAGEAFGWSSLIGRDTYSASARCGELTKLLKLDRKQLHEILRKDTANELLFYKHMAVMLGNRLIQSYRMESDSSHIRVSSSYGTGQMMTSETQL